MRRGTLIYIGCIIALLAVGLWLQLTQPRPVDWTATYDHKDTGPFGCAVFDSVMAFTLPAGYRPVAETLDDFLENDTVGGQNLLFVSGYCWLNDEDVDSLFLRLHRGASVLMAADWFSDALLDSLGIIEADGFVLDGLDGVPSLRPAIDTLEWVEEPGRYPRRDFPVRSSFQSTGFQPTDSLGRYPFRVLAWQRHDRVYATDSGYVARRMNTVSFRVGKGELTLMRSPFVLTNYGILHRDLKDYVLRLADRLKDAPLVRTDAYAFSSGGMDWNSLADGRARGPFGYFLSHPPLQWALYVSLLTVVLLCCFTARRRQRPIPVMSPPENRSLEFVKLIGTLYYQRETPSALLRKKYVYFADELQRRTGVDLLSETSADERADRLAEKTGADRTQLLALLTRLDAIRAESPLRADDEEMKRLVDRMNDLLAAVSSPGAPAVPGRQTPSAGKETIQSQNEPDSLFPARDPLPTTEDRKEQ